MQQGKRDRKMTKHRSRSQVQKLYGRQSQSAARHGVSISAGSRNDESGNEKVTESESRHGEAVS